MSSNTKARLLLAAVAVLLAGIWAQHMLRLNATLGRMRYPESMGGLLPGDVWMLRGFGYLAGDISLLLLVLLALSWRHPGLVGTRRLIGILLAVTGFLTVYGLLCGAELCIAFGK